MTAMGESGDRASVILAARRSIRAHRAKRLCHFGCPGNKSCGQYEWALTVLPEHDR